MVVIGDPAASGESRSALFARDSSELADAIELAMRLGQFEIRFQPQFASADGRLVGAEALARWIHPLFGEIGARDLFAMAAKAGLAQQLAQHLTSRAIACASPWPAQLGLSLNIAPRQLLASDFVVRLADELRTAGIDPRQITLEITEEVLLGDLDLAARQLDRLREMGIRIALDDFGAGFCNFDYLKRLPLDALKLDRSMLAGVAQGERDLAVFRAIVTLADALGLQVVTEGVETESQRRVVVAEGCASWQGFLAGQPLPRAALMQRLQTTWNVS